MEINQETLASLLAKAAADPSFREELAGDSLGTIVDAGIQVSIDDLKRLLDLQGVTNLELIEVVRERILRVETASCNGCTHCAECGCAGCGTNSCAGSCNPFSCEVPPAGWGLGTPPGA